MAGSDIIGGFRAGFGAMQALVDQTRTIVTERRHRDEAKKFNLEVASGRERLAKSRTMEEAELQSLLAELPMETREDELRAQVFAFQKKGEIVNKYADSEQELIHTSGANYPGNPHVEKAWGDFTKGAFQAHQAEQGQLLNASKAMMGQMGDELDHVQSLEHAQAQRGEYAPGTAQFEQQQREKRETVRAKALQAVMNAHAKKAGGNDLLQMVQLGQVMGADGKIDPTALEALEAKLGASGAPLNFEQIAGEALQLTDFILNGTVPEGKSPQSLNVEYDIDQMGLIPEGASAEYTDQSGQSLGPAASTGGPSAAQAMQGASTGIQAPPPEAPGVAAGKAVRSIPSKVRAGVHAVEDEFSAGMAEKGTQVKGFLSTVFAGE